MIDHIEIHVGTERGNPEVILVGALAQILAFTQQNKTAASNESDGRALMVAGVGFVKKQLRVVFDPSDRSLRCVCRTPPASSRTCGFIHRSHEIKKQKAPEWEPLIFWLRG
ncbi:MAG: hypothetical protein HOL66_06835 [Rhodospirillaceae bacterium]|nr:hypothetical protein [Rhodospirillaceae bacterium]MBT5243942.1 hypothetical protein [Rhodospirillaceae bacterium]MBT5560923.1 hypothetical protein [Rhodospirillaceae bacterium]